MHNIFDALCRLLAPILVFTAEEAWGYGVAADAVRGPGSATPAANSVHMQLFPKTGESLRQAARKYLIERHSVTGLLEGLA